MTNGLNEDWTPFDSIMRLPVTCKNAPDHVVTYAVDARWWFAVNGNKEPRTVTAPQWGAIEVPGFHAAVFYNGWLAGLVTPYGGPFAAGSGANPKAFDDAVLEHLRSKEGAA